MPVSKGPFILLSFFSISLLLLTACNDDIDGNGNGPAPELTLIESFPLAINDPSGLVMDKSGDFLWTVSDDPGGHIHKISLTGTVLGVLSAYAGDDMEGITMNPNDGTLWIVEERLRKVIQLTTEGEVLQEFEVFVPNQNINDGLEGITWNPHNDHVYVVNEKNPRRFFEFDTTNDFDLIREVDINFSGEFFMGDLSGLYYDPIGDEIWFLSDDSKKLVVTDQKLTPLRTYPLFIDKFEGIAGDLANNRIYLVNDRLNRLYVFAYE